MSRNFIRLSELVTSLDIAVIISMESGWEIICRMSTGIGVFPTFLIIYASSFTGLYTTIVLTDVNHVRNF